MLTDITIGNFRGFTELKLTGLGRVNLIVGKNNAGKTSLLEAIAILADPALMESLPGLFRANAGMVAERFYRWLIRDAEPRPTAQITARTETGIEMGTALGLGPKPPKLLKLPNGRLGQPHDMVVGGLHVRSTQRKPLRSRAISVQSRAPEGMIQAFVEAVRLPTGERQVEALLQAVDPRFRTVRLDLEEKSTPLIVVDVGLSERIPLSQAGQGMYRLVAIFSELLGEKPDVAFIDEIENGIHHSVLEQVWAGLAEVAERLSVQLFVTTHSYECIEAAHAAFAKRGDYGLRILQLFRLKDRVEGRVLDRVDIETALDGGIDLR